MTYEIWFMVPYDIKQKGDSKWRAMSTNPPLCVYAESKKLAEARMGAAIHSWATKAPSPDTLIAYFKESEIPHRVRSVEETQESPAMSTNHLVLSGAA